MKILRRQYDRLPAEIRRNIRSLVPARILRWYAHHITDIYLLSYPKCGRTWLRLMIGKAIALHFSLPDEEDILFLRTNRKVHPDVPNISVVHDDSPMLKSPEELEVTKKRFHDKKVILLVRDPRDVVVSSFFEIKKRNKIFGQNPYENQQMNFDGELTDFINSKTGSFDTILAYYQIWAKNQHVPHDFLLIRYEDLKTDPSSELRRVLDFIGLCEINDLEIITSVAYASFENMRKMELEKRFQTGILNPGDPADQNSFKTRSGKISGYYDYLSREEIEALNLKMDQNLPEMFGYRSG
jgi:hypothetical protein